MLRPGSRAGRRQVLQSRRRSQCVAGEKRLPDWRSGREHLGFAPLAEKSIGLVEEKDPTLMLGLVENVGQVFLGFANVFRDDQGEVNVVNLPARGLAEQAGSHGFARPWRAVKKGAITGAQFSRHIPLNHEGFTVTDPDFNLPDLAQGAGVQHKVGPIQLCLDVAGREFGAQIRPARVTRRKEPKILFGEPQRAFQYGFVPTLRDESQNTVLRKKVLAFEQRLERKAKFQVVGCQDECERLAGRYELAVRGVREAAELGEPAIEGLIFGMENIQ